MSSRILRRILAGLLVLIALAAGVVIGTVHQVQASPSQSASPHAQAIVDNYLHILNTGMASGTCDFSAMASVYAPDATVIGTGGPFAPGGPFGSGGSFGEQQFHGIAAIEGFLTKLCHIVSANGVAQWTQDSGYLLAPTVLNSYEHVSFSGQLAGRCMHVFTVSGDRITSLDWSIYA